MALDILGGLGVMKITCLLRTAIFVSLLFLTPSIAFSILVTLRDISHVQGLRENPLIGYGLVVGLQGTGDSRNSLITSRSVANMLEKFGLNFNQKDLSARNVAAVMITSTLNAFVREGDRIDVQISSLGDAKSLQGGTLLMAPLFAGNQKSYATAQGPVSVGGYYVGAGNQSIQKNVTTAGVIPNGGIVDKSVDSEFLINNHFKLTLNETDFVLASAIIETLEKKYGAGIAKTSNGTEIEINIPETYAQKPVAFIAQALMLSVDHQAVARVVIDERTGTVVVGGDVKISKVAVTHGGLHIAIAGDTHISQPLPLTNGQTVVAEDLSIRADEAKASLVVMPESTTIEELVRALNSIGTLPRDVIVILENLKATGALHAQIIAR
jgi:flagellar P-ring protein precursor FlgI